MNIIKRNLTAKTQQIYRNTPRIRHRTFLTHIKDVFDRDIFLYDILLAATQENAIWEYKEKQFNALSTQCMCPNYIPEICRCYETALI